MLILICNAGSTSLKFKLWRMPELIALAEGKVERVGEWGKRRLAYPINYKTEGYYLLVNFESEATLPREIERNLQIADQVLRYLVIRVEEKRSNVKPRPVRTAPAEEAAEAPAAE